ncbi:MAG: FG-GAP repeat protein [Actinobacteria bacterium]|nr:FG-GAP repeat protein [Actinomycetota bacterium]
MAKRKPSRCRVPLVLSLALALIILTTLPAPGATVQKDVADGDEDVYIYGGDPGEVLMFADTATGDVNDDGLPDLVIGHDQGGDDFPYFYTGKVYVYYGRSTLDPEVDLGTEADVVINGYYGSFLGNSVACGDLNGDGIDDILMGAIWDSPGGGLFAGAVAVVFGRADLEDESPWDFNAKPPDLYLSSANGGEMCGMSVIAGDIDGDGFDDALFGAHLGNGGMHHYDAASGAGWSAQGRANQDFIHDLSMIDATHGWAVGKYISAYDTIYRYDGNSWQADTLFHQFKVDLHGVAAYDTSHAWAVGEGGTIIFNGNYSNSKGWTAQASGTTADLRDAAAVSASDVWAVGDGGTILHHDGSSWSAQSSGTTADLHGIAAVSASDVWAVGDGGTILHYDGSSWSPVDPSPTAHDLRAVSAASASCVWAVGDGGTILKYDGSGWSAQSGGTTTDLRGVAAGSATAAWAVGEGGTILKTIDGGANWSQELVLFSQDQNAVDAVDANRAWTCGEAATGRAYIVWGRDTWPAWDYNNPIKPNKVINGITPLDSAGYPVSLGDLNGDTKLDMVIGAFDADGPDDARDGCGEAYVVYGRNKGAYPYFIDLASNSDCTIYGASPMDGLPTSMCQPLKKINDDRFDDLLFGVMWADGPGESRGGCGEVVVVYGGDLTHVVDLASTPADITIYGPDYNAGAGYSVDALYFNADPVRDIAVGSTGFGKGTGRQSCGAAWLVNGVSPWPSQVDLAGGAGMIIYGAETGDVFGACLASANLDGDATGHEDLVVSASMGDGPGNARPACGEHFVFLGYDIVPPTCAITNVADGSVLAGTVGVEVSAYDHHGIDRVEFWVNGVKRAEDTTAPYRWDWDTRQDTDAPGYSLEARAYDVNGNNASDSRTVSVNNTVPPLSRIWYLAEGTTAWGFETWVLVQNPNPFQVTANVTFMKPGGATQSLSVPVDGNSRFTINVNALVPESDVSTRVEATAPVICERAMYWNNRAGGHDTIGVAAPSPTWFLAEGTTAWGFETWLSIQNPNPTATDVIITFMKPGGITQTVTLPVAGYARQTVSVNALVQESDVSTRVEAKAPVICERAMYRYGRDLGHVTIGTPSASRDWYLAEGTTAWGFEEYITVQNPNPQPAVVNVEFMLPDGTVRPFGLVVPGNARQTIGVDSLPGLGNSDLSAHLSSNVPIICERPMYWSGATSRGGHDTIGTPMPSTRWYLAEGTTAWGFEEYIMVQNPNAAGAVVSFTFMKPKGETVFLSVPVAARSRFTLKANDVVPSSDISTSVLSSLPVICERVMYWRNRDGGHVSIGVRGE